MSEQDIQQQVETLTTRMNFYKEKLDNLEKNKPFSFAIESIFFPIRWLGYAFLLLSFIDIGLMFYPLDLFNPHWELGLLHTLTQHMPVFAMGILAVFFGAGYSRNAIETWLLFFFSWFLIILALLMLLIIPLTIKDTLRVKAQYNQAITQNKQHYQKIENFNLQIQKVVTIEDLKAIQPLLQEFNVNLNLEQEATPEQITLLKNNFAKAITPKQQQIENILNININKKKELIKRSIATVMASFIYAVFYFLIFLNTVWARIIETKEIDDD